MNACVIQGSIIISLCVHNINDYDKRLVVIGQLSAERRWLP